VKGRAIACTIQLGSISSLRCQKSRMPLSGERYACEKCFSRTMWLRVLAIHGLDYRLACRAEARGNQSAFSPVELRRDSLARSRSEGWWSQTGSNRRPHACKARALPAELWPRKPEDECFTSVVEPSLFQGETHPIKWWAWEDLNFRPHAYQARALTN
jgi:hypothetical protein